MSGILPAGEQVQQRHHDEQKERGEQKPNAPAEDKTQGHQPKKHLRQTTAEDVRPLALHRRIGGGIGWHEVRRLGAGPARWRQGGW